MGDLELSFAMTPYDRIQPLIDGEVTPQGIALDYTGLPVPDIFYRLLKFSQFDVSEMSFSSFLRARAQGWGYQMLPVFHNRNFSYTRTLIRLSAGIRPDHPEDLKGKRVGAADYQQTAALWARGVLQHEFGVQPQDMIWYQERSEHLSHGGATGFQPPAGVEFHYTTTDFGTMFLNGDLDAAVTYITGTGLDRAKADLSHNPDYSLLFSDAKAEGLRYYQKTRIYPPHHITVVRESLLRQHPWLAISLVDAFERAKKLAMERLYQRSPSLLIFGTQEIAQQRATFGDDPYVYGIEPNAEAIDMVQTISLEQELTDHKQPWEELFAHECLVAEEQFLAGRRLTAVT